ncbi:MAG: VacJ family lipoprotein [Pseudomonadales bacterium]|nr:VacJ family lipoprotein [Pseudomonadales bacterium]
MKKYWIVSLLMSLSCLAYGEADQGKEDRLGVDVESQEMVDPWYGFNYQMFEFNQAVDHYFLKPIAQGYRYITPELIDQGITNVFQNLGDVNTVANSLLQLKPHKSAMTTSRIMFNTTFGIFGFFDVATEFGIERDREDFGQTLAYWGLPAGNYLMLPLLGPSNPRDLLGRVGDFFMPSPVSISIDSDAARDAITAVRVVDVRADLIPAERMVFGDKYQFIRNAYLQNREFLINDGVVEDTFSAEDDAFLEDF